MAKVLLADDSVTIHKVVEIILTAKGFTLKAVGDGETALEEVRSFKPDVVLADIEMPGLSGYELSEKIKKNPSTKDIPVILLAGAFETIDNSLAQRSGASSILIKPFESEDLIGKIREVISPEAAAAAPVKQEQKGEVLEVEGLEAGEEEAEEEAEEEPFEEMPEMAGFEEFSEEPAKEELTPIEDVSEAEAELTAVEEVEEEAEPLEAVEAVEEAEPLEAVEEVTEAEPLEAVEEAEPVEAAEAVSEAEAELTSLSEPEPEAELTAIEEPETVEVAEAAEEIPVEAATVGVPGSEALSDAFRKAADEQIAEFIRTLDMKELMKEALAPTLGDSVEKILWEIIPELTEKLASETLKDSMVNLKKELETVIWETVPEIAENMINKEIQRIREET
jgi:CheY-like chemotaxis protein